MEEFQINNFQGDFQQGDYQGEFLTTSDDAKSRKTKTIIVASVAGVVVLAAAIWGIVSIVSSVNNKKTSDTTAAVATEENNDQLGVGVNNPAENLQTPSQPATDLPALNPVTTPVEAVESVPETGPSDMVLTALLMGAATTLLLNLAMKKQEA